MIENNPLKQYFRRPVLYFRLPSLGTHYEAGVVDIPDNLELPVYPMTAIDEMTIRTPDALFNGVAIVDLIKSCVPNIKDPWRLNSIDLDATIIAIKAATNDGVIGISTTCPECKEVTDFDVNLLPLLADIKDVDYSELLKIRELEIKFRPLTYSETNKNNIAQFQIQKTMVEIQNLESDEEKQKIMSSTLVQLSEMVIDAIAGTIEFINTPEVKVTDTAFIKDFLNNCDKETNNAIKERSLSLREKNEIDPLEIKCPKCQHQYKQKIIINAVDFFDIG